MFHGLMGWFSWLVSWAGWCCWCVAFVALFILGDWSGEHGKKLAERHAPLFDTPDSIRCFRVRVAIYVAGGGAICFEFSSLLLLARRDSSTFLLLRTLLWCALCFQGRVAVSHVSRLDGKFSHLATLDTGLLLSM